jgi:hypothetical protein
MDKDKAIFSSLNECNTNKIFVGDDRTLSVVGSGTIQVYNGHFNDVLCVPSLSRNLLSIYQINSPSDQHQTRSQFQRASSLLAQVLETHDPKTFAEASGHPDWDT